MTFAKRTAAVVVAVSALQFSGMALAQDWAQYKGGNHDGKAAGFIPPAKWPETLTSKWKISVGDGVATPALVGGKLFVFSRQGGNEVTRCLDAGTGKEIWNDQYPALAVTGMAGSFPGPRSSPAVADGKVVTLGAHGMLSCLDAATGKKLWRKDDLHGEPRFSVASSPLIVNGLCIAQLGGRGNGGIVAYDLTSGDEKWKWTGDAPDYASPTLMTIGDAKLIIAETAGKIVALNAADGKLAWETPFAPQGMGAYNAATPVVDGQIIIYSGGGRGTRAVKLEKSADGFAAKELWSNADESVQFSSPVVKDGFVYALSQSNDLFCLDEQTGKKTWSQALAPGGGGRPGGGGGRPGGGGGRPGGGGGRPGGGGRMGGGGSGGYGSLVDAGSVLVALTPKSELVVFQPDSKAFTQTAKIKVADTATYAYPVLSGNHIFIKDQDSLAMLTAE